MRLYNNRVLVLSLLTAANLIVFHPNKVLADGFNLTQPNAGPCNSTGASQGLSLTESNVCSDKILLQNPTAINIYYDFGNEEDKYLPSNRQVTWTLHGSNRSVRTVIIDENINIPGIQEKRYAVYSGNTYYFGLQGNKIILYSRP
ncbi:MAG: hypothetical protein QNJ68_17420 [Microcoleaceae cyanobacterium MO_207.B10]|nr:hypothetical protein [Microcoleaceae cyanobacterium MO_207.B10]